MHLVAVPADVIADGHVRLALLVRRERREVHVRQALFLGHAVRDVDAEPVHTPVEPEPPDALELLGDLGIGPVEVGLLGREQVEVPLAVGDASPGRAAERGRPVVRRQPTVVTLAGSEVEPRALTRPGAGREGLLEPLVLIREVVRDRVDRDLDVARVRRFEQRVEVGERSEHRVDIARVTHVVAVVGHRRGEERRDPDGVDAEIDQMIEPLAQADQVTVAVTVAVGVAARIHLVEHGGGPPRSAAVSASRHIAESAASHPPSRKSVGRRTSAGDVAHRVGSADQVVPQGVLVLRVEPERIQGHPHVRQPRVARRLIDRERRVPHA